MRTARTSMEYVEKGMQVVCPSLTATRRYRYWSAVKSGSRDLNPLQIVLISRIATIFSYSIICHKLDCKMMLFGHSLPLLKYGRISSQIASSVPF